MECFWGLGTIKPCSSANRYPCCLESMKWDGWLLTIHHVNHMCMYTYIYICMYMHVYAYIYIYPHDFGNLQLCAHQRTNPYARGKTGDWKIYRVNHLILKHLKGTLWLDIHTYMYIYGGFLKWGYPQFSSILVGFSVINQPAIGISPFMETTISSMTIWILIW